MNVIRLQEILRERYNTHFLGLRNKLTSRSKPGSVCSYCNNLSSRPVGHTMQKTLKLKLQNALTQNSLANADSPAIFVGGRRRNRKKRKNKINGQAKRKTRRGVSGSLEVTPTTPESVFENVIPKYPVERPIVSCLDIEDPVFSYKPVTSPSHVTEEDNDSMYYSNESLMSFNSELDTFGKLVDNLNNNEDVLEQSEKVEDIQDHSYRVSKINFPRTHSEDSGVYDDESIADAGYDDTFVDDSDSSSEVNETHTSENIKDGDISNDEGNDSDNEDASTTAPTPSTETGDEFDEIDLEDETQDSIEGVKKLDVNINSASFTQDDDEDIVPDIKIIREVSDMAEADPFFKFVTEDGDDEVIFDLSQLELNNTQDNISSIKQEILMAQLNKVSNYPTELEEAILFKVPMDLLIDDDDDDEVLFEAGHRKELSMTCNPLYEHTLKEEEDRVSVKSYQSGFKTNFDNINVIQIPVPASDKAAHKSLKESSPLIKRRPPGGDRDDEIACCVIL